MLAIPVVLRENAYSRAVASSLIQADDSSGMSLWLVVARNVLDGELKLFVSNAGEYTSMAMLLQVAFQRWRVERCFEDQKQEIGLDCYEGRRYLGLKRHLATLSMAGVPWHFDEKVRAYRVREGFRFPLVEQAVTEKLDSCPTESEPVSIEQTATRLLKDGEAFARSLDQFLDALRSQVDCETGESDD